MLDCLPAVLLDDGRMRIDVTARLLADGRLRDVRLRPITPLPPVVGSCLVDVIQAVRAPAPDGGARAIRFPLWIGGS
jgi:hypothetical protein